MLVKDIVEMVEKTIREILYINSEYMYKTGNLNHVISDISNLEVSEDKLREAGWVKKEEIISQLNRLYGECIHDWQIEQVSDKTTSMLLQKRWRCSKCLIIQYTY